MRLSALTAFFNHVGVKPVSTAVWASLSMAASRDARGLDSADASGVGPFGFLTARQRERGEPTEKNAHAQRRIKPKM